MLNRIYVVISLPCPEDASPGEVVGYVKDAVETHAGGLNPDDPMYMIDRDDIRVTTLDPAVGPQLF